VLTSKLARRVGRQLRKVRGKGAKLSEGEGGRKVRLGQDSLPNIAISAAETSGKWGRCFTHTPVRDAEINGTTTLSITVSSAFLLPLF
jgi:hypothetical protein